MGVLVLRSSAVAASSITPSVYLEHVNPTTGERTRTLVASDGSTSISGVVPVIVHIDASGARSTATDGDDEQGAFHNIGYHLESGEATGEFFAHPVADTYSMDEDYGPPIMGHVYRSSGTHGSTLTFRDSLGNETSVSWTVDAAASSTMTTVHIPVSDGAWPTFASSRRYTLDADGDYTSFGEIECDTLHNILFEKTGSGADPIVSAFTPESRAYIGQGGKSSSTTRAANVRTNNIDVGSFNSAGMGDDFCGVINGRCRQYGSGSHSFTYDSRCNDGTTAQAQSVKWRRGVTLWNCGEVNSNGNYVIIDSFRAGIFYGVTFNHSSGGNEHNIRLPAANRSVFKYCSIYNTSAKQSWVKGHGLEIWGVTNGDQPDVWGDSDAVGDPTLTGADDGSVEGFNDTAYGYPGFMSFFHRCVFGASGDTDPGTPCGWGPQNNDDDGVHEAVYLCGFEDCVLFGTPSFSSQSTFNYTGLGCFHRNIKVSMGAGANVSTTTGAGDVKTAPGYDASYMIETTNTRPQPSTV